MSSLQPKLQTNKLFLYTARKV
uniref:Uncharacterized protein n=1 Tax=Arundo donax TaxID=35708 RepID=A0A0A8YYJ9_ARUDO